ncbi:MAG: hypothetical protein ACP5VE_13010 [Chthonomonadales bacterium]
MACAKGKRIIQNWLDQPHGGPAPHDVATHLRECLSCRAFVQRWNAIEIQMMAARRDAPPLSHDLTRAIWTRIRMGRRPVSLVVMRRRALMALALGAAVIAVIALALASLRVATSAAHQASSALAVMRSAPAAHTAGDTESQDAAPAEAR